MNFVWRSHFTPKLGYFANPQDKKQKQIPRRPHTARGVLGMTAFVLRAGKKHSFGAGRRKIFQVVLEPGGAPPAFFARISKQAV
jgi:hypothetical protein